MLNFTSLLVSAWPLVNLRFALRVHRYCRAETKMHSAAASGCNAVFPSSRVSSRWNSALTIVVDMESVTATGSSAFTFSVVATVKSCGVAEAVEGVGMIAVVVTQPEAPNSTATIVNAASRHLGAGCVMVTGYWARLCVATFLAGVEVFCLRVVHHEGIRRLLRVELKLLRQLDADPRRVEEADQGGPVLEVRARGISERVARTPVCLVADHLLGVHRDVRQPQLVPHPVVPHLGQRLCELYGQAVQLEVLPVRVLGEQLTRGARHRRPHGDELELDHVRPVLLGLFTVAEEVGDAQSAIPALARVVDPADLVVERPGLGVEDDDRVAVRVARPVPVHDCELRDLLGADPLQPHPQAWAAVALDELFVRRVLAGLEAPLAQERRSPMSPPGWTSERRSWASGASRPARTRRTNSSSRATAAHA